MTLGVRVGVRWLDGRVHGNFTTAPAARHPRWASRARSIRSDPTARRSTAEQNNVHALDDSIDQRQQSAVRRGRTEGRVPGGAVPRQREGCRGSSLCNLGLSQPGEAGYEPGAAAARRSGRRGSRHPRRGVAASIRIETLTVRVSQKVAGAKGAPSEWAPGDYHVRARMVVAAAGAIGRRPCCCAPRSPLRAPSATASPVTRLSSWSRSTPHSITNDVGIPRATSSTMRVRAVRARDLHVLSVRDRQEPHGFRPGAQRHHAPFPRLQMILILALRSHGAGQSHRGHSGGEPVVHYRFTPSTVEGLVRGTRAAARIFSPPGSGASTRPPDPPILEAADADRLEERNHARHFRPGSVAVFGGAPHGRLRHGPDRRRLGDRRLGASARPALAPGSPTRACFPTHSRSTPTSRLWHSPTASPRASGEMWRSPVTERVHVSSSAAGRRGSRRRSSCDSTVCPTASRARGQRGRSGGTPCRGGSTCCFPCAA